MSEKSINKLNNDRDNKPVRLNKYLSAAGFCSRREADRLIEAGRVTVDGKKAVLGDTIVGGQQVSVDGDIIVPGDERILIAFNKPVGIECTTDLKNPDNIISYINYPSRIFPVGRLDKNSSGLILLTNDGELMNEILKSSNYHEKEYEVTVDKDITDDFIARMAAGVDISGVDGRGNILKNEGSKNRYYDITRPCIIKSAGKRSFNIILTQGLNRQIRRMCQALGYNVVSLRRIRIMCLQLGDLKEGTYRHINKEDLNEQDHAMYEGKYIVKE